MAPPSQQQQLLLSSSERLYILQGCQDNCRIDGRRSDEFRLYHHDNHNNSMLLPLCNGSARLCLVDHSTDLLVSVKAELVHPAPQTPNQGTIELSIEHQKAGQQQRAYCDQLQSLLSHLLLPYCLDLTSLCLVPNMYVWRLNIDVWILSSSGGSIVDACSQVILAALRNTQLPRVEILPHHQRAAKSNVNNNNNEAVTATTSSSVEWLVDSDISSAYYLYDDTVPSSTTPCVVMTVSVLPSPPPSPPPPSSNSNYPASSSSSSSLLLVLDATLEEEACAACQVHVSVDPQGSICATTMTQPASVVAASTNRSSLLSLGMLQEITDLAVSHAMELHQKRNEQQVDKIHQQDKEQQQQQVSLLQPYFSIQ